MSNVDQPTAPPFCGSTLLHGFERTPPVSVSTRACCRCDRNHFSYHYPGGMTTCLCGHISMDCPQCVQVEGNDSSIDSTAWHYARWRCWACGTWVTRNSLDGEGESCRYCGYERDGACIVEWMRVDGDIRHNTYGGAPRDTRYRRRAASSAESSGGGAVQR